MLTCAVNRAVRADRRQGTRSLVPVSVSDQAALVTGGASGIGAETVMRLAAAGAAGIVVADLDGDAAVASAQRARAKGVDAVAVRTDVSPEEDCQAVVDLAVLVGAPLASSLRQAPATPATAHGRRERRNRRHEGVP
jgi:hypothetical protein